MKRAQDVVSVELRIFCEGHERLKEAHEAERKELELREKEGQALNESVRKVLGFQIKQHEETILAIQESKENMMRHVEGLDGCTREKEVVRETLLEHEAKLHEEQVLALQVFKDDLAKMYVKRMEELDREQFMNAVKAVLDENDDKLKELKNEYGEEAYEVVTKALNKFNEHCLSKR